MRSSCESICGAAWLSRVFSGSCQLEPNGGLVHHSRSKSQRTFCDSDQSVPELAATSRSLNECMSNATSARQPGPGRLLVHDGEEKNATSLGSCGVFDVRSKDEHVSGTERVLVAGSGECYFAFDDLDRDRPVSPVSWQISTRRDAKDREPERAFLDE